MGNEVKEPKVWSILGCIGYGIGIGTISTCWSIWLPLVTGPVGIVLSALGLKSQTHHGKAKTGLILSIIGTAIALLILIIIIAVIAAEGSYYY